MGECGSPHKKIGHMDALKKKIESRLSEIKGPYPTADVSRVASGPDHGAFAGNFELYVDYVYGCASSLKLLDTARKSREELLEIRRRLSTSVFDRHPEYEQYRTRITPQATPSLFALYTATELNRLDLLDLLDGVLSRAADEEKRSPSG